MSRTSLTPEQRTPRARAAAYDKLTLLSALGVVGVISIEGWWPLIALGVMVVTGSAIFVAGSVTVAWLAIRKTDPKDVPKTVTALAELFRWWRLR